MFTLEKKSKEWERRHPQYAAKATPENEARYAEMLEMVEIAEEIAASEAHVVALEAVEPYRRCR